MTALLRTLAIVASLFLATQTVDRIKAERRASDPKAEFFGGGIQEFDRLVATKLALSAVSLAVLALAIHLLGAFSDPARDTA